MLDSKFEKLRKHFGISTPEDWQNIRPEWVLATPGVGSATLQFLRMYLANLGLTMQNDGCPKQWQELLGKTRFGGMQISEQDEAEVCPFTILIDSQEKHPFVFQGLRHDADAQSRPLAVPIMWKSLGAHHGDYSLSGWEGHVAIERKSMNDAHGTFLGWSERRERFEEELEYLSGIECAAVVIECTRGQLYANAPSQGKKSSQENAKILMRTVLSWEQRFSVPFMFCDTRRLAEVEAFRLLQQFFRHKVQEAKAVSAERQLAVNQQSVDEVERMLAGL